MMPLKASPRVNPGKVTDHQGSDQKQNKWLLNRPLGQVRSLVKDRAKRPAEAGRKKTVAQTGAGHSQLPRRIFTERCRTASMPSKACLVRCSSRLEKSSLNASKRLPRNISTFRRTKRFIRPSSISGMRVKVLI